MAPRSLHQAPSRDRNNPTSSSSQQEDLMSFSVPYDAPALLTTCSASLPATPSCPARCTRRRTGSLRPSTARGRHHHEAAAELLGCISRSQREGVDRGHDPP
ncbi:hypothetical protein MLD38_020416 [Melastoma candidum]|uniref:Uncharacterized protein n=1 Tax=Melastoma candidum TaxID=119954 RepID=A0ACB9QD73_9MYRT|nr:hypothetical protein MLD38_020416 [Melastoma candidum]